MRLALLSLHAVALPLFAEAVRLQKPDNQQVAASQKPVEKQAAPPRPAQAASPQKPRKPQAEHPPQPRKLQPPQQRPLPVVSGTKLLEPLEMEGKMPIFVDAFLNKEGTGAYVVLNFSPLFSTHSHADAFLKWSALSGTKWSCSWAPPPETHGESLSLETYEVHTAVEEATVLFSSVDALVKGPEAAISLNRFHALLDGDNDTDAQDVATQFRYRHHAMVLGCKLPEHMDKLPKWRLSVSALSGEEVLYERSRIPVERGSFFRDGTKIALCTMINRVTELLRPWVAYHAASGFEQILLYMEEADTAAANEVLRDLVEEGRVTIVPFFFGAVSEQRDFHLQAGMEQHCLYQARGRVTWLGHADEDEFFELRTKPSGTLEGYLKSQDREAVAISVRSQQWRIAANVSVANGSVAFPCSVTCKRPGYAGKGKHTKWIAKPELISISNPHNVDSTGLVHNADPDHEIRLNHFRRIFSNMTTTENEGCKEDLSFRDKCNDMVHARFSESV